MEIGAWLTDHLPSYFRSSVSFVSLGPLLPKVPYFISFHGSSVCDKDDHRDCISPPPTALLRYY